MIANNLARINRRIADAANRVGRSESEVRIVAAAKSQGMAKIEQAIAAGIRIIGHNYLQEAERETPARMPEGVQLHMIGHLQKNKAGKAAELFDVIETVDDLRLAEALSRRAHALGKGLGVLIQVNLSGETQKSGISEEEVSALAQAIRGLPGLSLLGLMTMPPFFDDPDRVRPYFAHLRRLRDELIDSGVLSPGMKELSMGMTGDYEVAVEEGATLVRIGTALFGSRP
ncbi:MAG: YggS family pyridoxal phosphate-dependent enzyme [Thermodesulfobacteriota bacterium]